MVECNLDISYYEEAYCDASFLIIHFVIIFCILYTLLSMSKKWWREYKMVQTKKLKIKNFVK